MCEECKKRDRQLALQADYIDTLTNIVRPMFKGDDWLPSEPMAAGGPQGVVALRSPFTGSCQFKIDSASSGAGGAQVLLSTMRQQTNVLPGYLSTDKPTSELGPIVGFLLNLPASNAIPVDSEWYDLTNSENTLYLHIITTSAAYLNIKFRQRR